MKTSNKLLFGALIVVLIFITITISMSKHFSGTISSSKKETVVRTTTSFQNVEVEGNILVYIHQSNKYSVSVKAPTSIISQIITDVENDKLHIYSKRQNNIDTIIVEIYATNLSGISASAGANIFIPDHFKTDTFTCNSSSGSFVKCSINSKKLVCNATSGAEINLDGQVNYLEISASSGAEINAKAIRGEQCSIEGSSGAEIEINDIKFLDVNINSGCQVTYSGLSKLGNKAVSTDAELIKQN